MSNRIIFQNSLISRILSICLAVSLITLIFTGCGSRKSSVSSSKRPPVSSAEAASKASSSQTITAYPYLKYTNTRYVFSVDYPAELAAAQSSDNGDGQTFSNTSKSVVFTAYGSNNVQSFTAANYLQQVVLPTVKDVVSTKQDSNWFEVTWQEGDSIVFQKTVVGTGSIDTFSLKYPASEATKYTPILQHMSESLQTPEINTGH